MTISLDPSSYKWTQSSVSSSVWQRKTLASESRWICRPKDPREIFISGTLTPEEAISSLVINAAVKTAWRHLHFVAPELLVNAHFDKDGQAWMKYTTPSNDIENYVGRTTLIESRSDGQLLGFENLREKILKMKMGLDRDQAFVYVRTMLGKSCDLILKLEFILNFDHLITDGIGARILTGRYLSLLSQALSAKELGALSDEIDWKGSWRNLSPPWIEIMNKDQKISGAGYETAVEMNMKFFEQKSGNPGLPLLNNPSNSRVQSTHFITFTEIQSTLLNQTIKTLVTPQTSITSLAHAATILALLQAHPPSPTANTLFSPCYLNGRRYLDHPIRETEYTPICLSFAPLIFPNLRDFILDANAEKNKIKIMLLKLCGVASEEYQKLRERTSVLPENVTWMERIGSNMWKKSQNSSFDGSSNVVQKPADLPFLSDGITEKYIAHSYTSSGTKVFEVDDIQFAAHAERKELIVRMSSWKGRTTISGEWVSGEFAEGAIVQYLNGVVETMFSILD